MTFAQLTPFWVAAGALGLAGALVLAQRLRVRHQPRVVVTTLFWKEALEEARARVFVRRFRHPLAFLLVLIISLLMWLGFAEPRVASEEAREHVVLLDGSAGMAWGQRFAETTRLLTGHLDGMPAARRTVVLCGETPATLLAPGEHEVLLEKRLENVRPAACPASIEVLILDQAARHETGRPVEIVVAGDAPIRQSVLDLLPETVVVRRLAAPPVERDANRGITALGVTGARSGRWDHVDVLVTVRGVGPERPLVVELAGRPVEARAERQAKDGGTETVVLRDLPANGNVLTLRLEGPDAFPEDDTARIALPERPLIRVAVAPPLRAAIEPALRADPAVVVTAERPDVTIGGPEAAPAIPSIRFVPTASQSDAFLVRHEPSLVSDEVVLTAFARLGLEEIDAMDLAQAQGRVISIGASPAPRRGVDVWDSLLSPRYNFVQSRSFPLFLARTIRWLLGHEPFPAYVAAGERVPGERRAFRDEAGRQHHPAGGTFVPAAAGTFESADGGRLVAALTDPAATLPTPRDALESESRPDRSPIGFGLSTWLGVIALGFVLLEWWLFRTGRMP